jgi:hypothetical protein
MSFFIRNEFEDPVLRALAIECSPEDKVLKSGITP